MIQTFADMVATVQSDAAAAPVLSYGLQLLHGCPATPGTLVVVGGGTGAGKSFFGLKLLDLCLLPGLYVSLEDEAAEVARRVSDDMAPSRLGEVLFVRPKKPRLSLILQEILKARESGYQFRLVVIDYVQLIQYDGDIPAWSQTEQIGMIIQEFKALGRELGFVVVLNCQLRRPNREAPDSFPSLWDLRDSSNIENSAEVVVLLCSHGDQLEARVGKNKSGKTGATAWFQRGPSGFLTEVAATPDWDLFDDVVEEIQVFDRKLRMGLPYDDLFADAA